LEKRLLLIMNPRAGQKRANRYLPDMLRLFSDHGYVITAYMTGKQGDAADFVKSHAADADLVVAVGGDGTLNETVNGLLAAGIRRPVGYIPAGSTNDFAASLKLSSNIMQAARDIMEGTPRTVDVGDFNGRSFTYVASFGAFTAASYNAPQPTKNVLGHLAYVLEGVKDLQSLKPRYVRASSAEYSCEGSYIFGAVSNSTSVGGILTLNPDIVDMNDGVFEILLIKAPNTIAELNDIVVALTTQNYDYPSITFATASELTVYASPNIEWSLDGEWGGAKEAFRVKNLHSAIKLIM